MTQILNLLSGSDSPANDQKTVLKAQILFWLIGATDGHAKNFSVFLGPGGSYHLTLLYDVLTAQPSLEAGQIERKQMKLAMSVGTNVTTRSAKSMGGILSRQVKRQACRNPSSEMRSRLWRMQPEQRSSAWKANCRPTSLRSYTDRSRTP